MIARLFDQPSTTLQLAGATVTLPPEARFGSIDSVREYVERVVTMPVVRERFSRSRVPVAVRSRRGVGEAHYEFSRAPGSDRVPTIAIPEAREGRWALRELVVLHEIAHHLDDSGGPAHGPHFVQTLIDLVEVVIGPEAAFVYRVLFGDAGLL